MMSTDKSKVVFLTNLPAPYRFPIWDRMSQKFDLKVVFLLKENNWRKWPSPKNVAWDFEFMSFNSIRIKEYEAVPAFLGAKRILKDSEVAIIGSWETPFYMRSIFLAKRMKIPIIQVYESTANSQRIRKGPVPKFRARLFSKATLVITFGRESSDAVVSMGVPKSKILELFNPVDVAEFHIQSRKHLGPSSPGHKYIYVGQLIERKNVGTLINAFAQIREENDILSIVGEGKLLRELKDLVAKLGLNEHVSFLGQLDLENLTKAYAQSNTLVLPSSNEVWGLVVNEALACGLHVVVSTKCGVAPFASNMVGSFICDTDCQSIARQMDASRRDWQGHVADPEILDYSPAKFADRLNDAILKLVLKS
jgi:glycosyltransferase involved in cell wall biosynthesis